MAENPKDSVLMLRLPTELHRAVKMAAAHNGESMSKVARRLFGRYVEKTFRGQDTLWPNSD